MIQVNIQPNELRLGNWVNLKKKDGNFMETFVFFINRDTASVDSDKGNPYYYSDLYTIPLTVDILSKCGFEKVDNCSFGDDKGWLIDHAGAEFSFGKGKCPLVTISSLHQLQNLYFALTGEELLYKKKQ